jgi:Lipid A 3-O-deacylase (PagL)
MSRRDGCHAAGVCEAVVRMIVFLGLVLSQLVTTSAAEDPKPFDRTSRTRGLLAGWAHSWRPLALIGETDSDIGLVVFQPRMGWFVSERMELYGEGTFFLYHEPEAAATIGLAPLAVRYHFRRSGRVIPYLALGAGFVWTSLDVPEIDRVFNLQVFGGAGVRFVREKGPGLIIELRMNHISNANTVRPNRGVDVTGVVVGVEWILRRRS